MWNFNNGMLKFFVAIQLGGRAVASKEESLCFGGSNPTWNKSIYGTIALTMLTRCMDVLLI